MVCVLYRHILFNDVVTCLPCSYRHERQVEKKWSVFSAYCGKAVVGLPPGLSKINLGVGPKDVVAYCSTTISMMKVFARFARALFMDGCT